MFLSNRFIAAGLLVFYGIPMAIGPSWHRHDQSCDGFACHVTEHSQGDSGSPQASANSPDTAGGGLQATDARDECLVCAFYAQSQLAARVSERLADEALLHSIATILSFSRSHSLLAVPATGPKSSLRSPNWIASGNHWCRCSTATG